MAGWTTKPLESVLDIQNGYAFKSSLFGEVGMPLIRIRDIAGGCDTETRYDGPFDERYVVRAGDFLIGMDGEFKCYEWRGGDALLNQRVCKLTDFSSEIDPRFVLYGINKHLKDIEAHTGFATVKHLSSKAILGIKFSFPSLAEQSRIVAILDEAFAGIDNAIANTEKTIESAQELFESWHVGAFSSGCSSWTNTILGEVAEFKNGLNFTKSSKGDTIKIVGVSDFQNNLWVPTNELDSVQIDGPLAETYQLREGDIVTVRSNGNKQLIGRCVLAGPVTERTSHSGFTIRIRITAAKLNPKFLAQQLKSPAIRTRLVKSGNGANISSLNQQTLKALPISYPSFDEQTRIVEKFDSMNDRVAALKRSTTSKLLALAELRRSLLAKAFSGQLATKRTTVVGAAVGSHQRTSEFCAAVLAFAYQRHAAQRRERTFGHVKAQKTLHLVETIAGVDLGRYPIKDAAGPNDFGHMLKAEEWAKSRSLFEFANRSNGYDFKPLANFKKEVEALVSSLSAHRKAIGRVVDLLIPMNSQEAEVLATVHAAWNNLLADGKPVDDSAIVYEARENWHASKLKIAESKFRDAIKFIRANGIVPDGTAKLVRGQDRLL